MFSGDRIFLSRRVQVSLFLVMRLHVNREYWKFHKKMECETHRIIDCLDR